MSFLTLINHLGGNSIIKDAQRKTIKKNRPNIIQLLNLEETLLSKLQAVHVISDETAAKIRNKPLDDDKNTIFLDMLLKRSQENLTEFIEICSEENQGHVADLFRCDTGLYTFVYYYVVKNVFVLYFAA